MTFFDDQLGKMVRMHIEEQERRFHLSNERIATKQSDLKSVQQQQQQSSTASAAVAPLAAASLPETAAPPTATVSLELFNYQSARIDQLERNFALMMQNVESLSRRVHLAEAARDSARLELGVLREALTELQQQQQHQQQQQQTAAAVYHAAASPPTSAAATTTVSPVKVAASTAPSSSSVAVLKEKALQEVGRPLENRSDFTTQSAIAKETVCDQCFNKAICTPCSSCESEWYCSVQCALLRRDKHHPACELLKEMKRRER